jgi:hypothetical protein
MKKTIVLLVLISALLTISACIDISNITSIELSQTPKENFELNEEFDLRTLTIKVNFSDETSSNVSIETTGVSITKGLKSGSTYLLDTTQVGVNVLRIMYQGFMIEFDYVVFDPSLWNGQTRTQVDHIQDKPGEYEISTAAEYVWLVENYNDGIIPALNRITLTNDINFDYHFVPTIQIVKGGFVFDGGNHQLLGLFPQIRLIRFVVFDDPLHSITFKDLKIPNVDLIPNTGFGLLLFSNIISGAVTKGIINVENVDISGKILHITGINGGYLGLIGGNTVVNFINCKNALTITSAMSNTGGFIGHNNGAIVHFDATTINHANEHLTVTIYNNDNANKLLGWIAGTVHVPVGVNFSEVNTPIIATPISLADVEYGQHYSMKKSDSNVTTIITLFQYAVNPGGITRLLTSTINVSSVNTTTTIVLPVKKMYVTRDVNLINHDQYIVNQENIDGIRPQANVYVLELDNDGMVIAVHKHGPFNTNPS